jgi:hypothetical protein
MDGKLVLSFSNFHSYKSVISAAVFQISLQSDAVESYL